MALAEETLRRLLVAKHLLASSGGQLTPHSDATSVARMILAAHDAAELALAAIASHVNVSGLRDQTYLMDYPGRIASAAGVPFPGTDYLRQLNAARTAFKHHGILPDARSWYRVVDTVWNRIDQWCQTYLGTSLDSIDLEQLLADPVVKQRHQEAKKAHRESRYREALEHLGLALFQVLRRFPGVLWPAVGSGSTETALMLTAFGVRPSDFLGLQDFLPRVSLDLSAIPRKPRLEWDKRGKGHEGNWTDENVRFCLETFLDLALKVQHAPPVPMALDFTWVFHDVITPKDDHADLFEYVDDRSSLLTQRVVGRNVVRTLRAGEKLQCHLSPSRVQEKPQEGAVSAAFTTFTLREATVETADVLAVWLPEEHSAEPGGTPIPKILYVDREGVEVLAEPRDDPFVREMCPHLFPS